MSDPERRAGDDSAMTVVFRTQSDIEATIVRGLLESRGIYAAVSSGLTHALFPLSIDGLGEVRIAVMTPDADAARAIIREQRAQQQASEVVPFDADIRDLSALETRLDYRFNEPAVLDRALTHRSKAHEDATGSTIDNESMEFLGDAVLGFVMADLLFREFPQFDEGQKSKIKASLVSADTLARLGRRLGLGEFLALGRGEEKTGGRAKHALLADCCEAVIAAIYLDGGMDAARTFIVRVFASDLEDVRSPEFWARDYKSALQELVQAREYPLPEYSVAAESGPDHRKIFHVEVRVHGEVMGAARGPSKKAAEQEAAHKAMDRLSAG
jgi:ribonuclease III